MTTYTGDNSVFNSQVYIFDNDDLVLGGLNGASNIPVKQLADNSSYLKKFKGRIIRGTGEPTATGNVDLTGFSLTLIMKIMFFTWMKALEVFGNLMMQH